MLGLDRLTARLAEISPRRRLLLGFGVGSFVAGVVLLVVGFALLDSRNESPPEGPAVIDLGDIGLEKLDGLSSATPAATPAGTPQPPLGDQPYRLIIEKLGVNAPVNTYGLDAQARPEVPTGADANQTIAWYNWSAKPGIGGNAVFAGHVTWNGPAVFYKLAQVAEGDHIRLQGTDGKELVYSISSVFSVDPNDPDSLKVMQQTDRDMLTLITCTGQYSDTNDPIFGGEYDSRLVVRAELAAVNDAPAAGG